MRPACVHLIKLTYKYQKELNCTNFLNHTIHNPNTLQKHPYIKITRSGIIMTTNCPATAKTTIIAASRAPLYFSVQSMYSFKSPPSTVQSMYNCRL